MPQVLASTSQVLGKRKQRLTRLSTVRLYLIDDVEVRQALSSWDMQTLRLQSIESMLYALKISVLYERYNM